MCRYLKMAFALGFAMAVVVYLIALVFDDDQGDLAAVLLLLMMGSVTGCVVTLRSLLARK